MVLLQAAALSRFNVVSLLYLCGWLWFYARSPLRFIRAHNAWKSSAAYFWVLVLLSASSLLSTVVFQITIASSSVSGSGSAFDAFNLVLFSNAGIAVRAILPDVVMLAVSLPSLVIVLRLGDTARVPPKKEDANEQHREVLFKGLWAAAIFFAGVGNPSLLSLPYFGWFCVVLMHLARSGPDRFDKGIGETAQPIAIVLGAGYSAIVLTLSYLYQIPDVRSVSGALPATIQSSDSLTHPAAFRCFLTTRRPRCWASTSQTRGHAQLSSKSPARSASCCSLSSSAG